MRILTLYIFKELIGPIFLSVAFFTVVLLMVELLDLATTLLRAGVPGATLLQLCGIILVTLLSMTIPMAVLLGILVGVGRLTNENEILAIRVGGVSVARVFAPVIIAAVLLSGVLMWMNNGPIPRLFRHVEVMVYDIQYELLTSLEPGRIYDELDFPGMSLKIVFDAIPGAEARATLDPAPAGGSYLAMEGVQIHMRMPTEALGNAPRAEQEGPVEFLLFSRYGTIAGDPATNEISLTLYDGTWIPLDDTVRNISSGTTRTMYYDKLVSVIGGPEFSTENTNPRLLSTGDLIQIMREPPTTIPLTRVDGRGQTRISRPWRAWLSQRNELITRFTLPLSVIAFTLIAIPLAMQLRARDKAISMVIAVGLMFLYYMGMTMGANVGARGVGWPLAIAAHMAANIAVSIVGIVLLVRAVRK